MAAPMTDRLPLIVGIAAHRRLQARSAAMLAELEARLTSIIAQLRHDYLDTHAHVGKTPVVVISNLIGAAGPIAERAAAANHARVVSPFGAASPQLAASLLAPDPARDHQAGLFIARYSNVLIVIRERGDGAPEAGGPADILGFRRRGVPLCSAHTVRACIDAAEIGPVIEIVLPSVPEEAAEFTIEVPEWGLAFLARHAEPRWRSRWHAWKEFVLHLGGVRVRPPQSRLSDPDKQTFESWTSFAAIIGLTKEFNIDAAALPHSADGPRQMAQSLEWLFGIDTGHPASHDAYACAMRVTAPWCRLYAIADTLAQQWQKQFRQVWFALFAAAFAAILCFEVFAHLAHRLLPPHQDPQLLSHQESPQQLPPPQSAQPPAHQESPQPTPHPRLYGWALAVDIFLLSTYVAALIAISWTYVMSVPDRHQERFLDYRALAEALRVGIFWRLMGVGELTGRGMPSVADAYPIKQPSELAWVKTCLWTLELLDHAAQPGAARQLDEQQAYYWLRDIWVAGQAGYFTRNAHRHNETAAIGEDRSFALVPLSMVVAAVLIVFECVFLWTHEELAHDVTILFIGVPPALAAAFLGFSEKLAYKAQARQYDRMRGVFGQALVHLQDPPTPAALPRIKRLFYHLGVEAMRENAEWVSIYRQRPIQPP
jgi:hypothetical protein